jgi:Tetratricopeptide repeat
LFREDDEEFINSMWFLTRLYADNAKFGEAQPRFEKALSTIKRVLGPQNLRTLFASNEYARFLRNTGKRTEAAVMYRRNLSELEKSLGSEHPLSLHTANGLA